MPYEKSSTPEQQSLSVRLNRANDRLNEAIDTVEHLIIRIGDSPSAKQSPKREQLTLSLDAVTNQLDSGTDSLMDKLRRLDTILG